MFKFFISIFIIASIFLPVSAFSIPLEIYGKEGMPSGTIGTGTGTSSSPKGRTKKLFEGKSTNLLLYKSIPGRREGAGVR